MRRRTLDQLHARLGRERHVARSQWRWRFPAVFSGTICVSGLENSLPRGAWSLDIFGWSAVVADEILRLTSPGEEIRE